MDPNGLDSSVTTTHTLTDVAAGSYSVSVDPNGLDSSVTTTHTLTDVAAGSYNVSVMAENEYGMCQNMTAAIIVSKVCPPNMACISYS